MSTTTASFRHEALLYEGVDGFLAGAVPFLREGLDRGEPALVAVGAEKIARLRAALDGDAGRVRFADMAELGANPGRIIPAWREFVAGHPGPARGIGEPIWAERGPEELVECQIHEALLNVAFADAEGFTLLCPYDEAALDPRVVHEARCSHPVVVTEDGARASADYRSDDLLAPFDAPLPTPASRAAMLAFEGTTLSDVRRLVSEAGESAGLGPQQTENLRFAASEVAANSIRHGGGRGVVRVWREDDALVCEVRDRGHIHDPLVGRHQPAPEQHGGRGVWLAHQLCDLVQVRSGAEGTVVRLRVRRAAGRA